MWDNASVDDGLERLRHSSNVITVRHTANLGFAPGNNRAAELSTSEFIAFLNPDAFPEPDWLERIVAAANTYGAEAIASLQLDDGDPELLDGAGDCMSIADIPWRGGYGQPRASAPSEPCEVFSACGAAALYRRAVFEALGGFEERFFCYCEDVDLGFRLRLAGGGALHCGASRRRSPCWWRFVRGRGFSVRRVSWSAQPPVDLRPQHAAKADATSVAGPCSGDRLCPPSQPKSVECEAPGPSRWV